MSFKPAISLVAGPLSGLGVGDTIQMRYATKRATTECLLKHWNELITSPEDAIYQKTLQEMGRTSP